MPTQFKYRCRVCGKVSAGRAPGVVVYPRRHAGPDGNPCLGSDQAAEAVEVNPRRVWRCADCQTEYPMTRTRCPRCRSTNREAVEINRAKSQRRISRRVPRLDAQNKPVTLEDAVWAYLRRIETKRAKSTHKMYSRALDIFMQVLDERGIPLAGSPASLPESAVAWLAESLVGVMPATERLYMTAVVGFYEYLLAEDLAVVNMAKLKILLEDNEQKAPTHMRIFSREDIALVIDYASHLNGKLAEDREERLRNLRDRALIVTLADTGLRIHEACNLLRGDIDQDEGRAIIIGKGNKQAVIRFTARSIQAIRDYLHERAALDGSSGRPLGGLPVFLRHDLPVDARKKRNQFKKMTTETGRAIVAQRVKECLGPDKVGTITPHSFRHYFVTVVLKASGNLKVAQELARHSNISTTNRYAHLTDSELDAAYHQALEPGDHRKPAT